jgi:hypothetical protein
MPSAATPLFSHSATLQAAAMCDPRVCDVLHLLLHSGLPQPHIIPTLHALLLALLSQTLLPIATGAAVTSLTHILSC